MSEFFLIFCILLLLFIFIFYSKKLITIGSLLSIQLIFFGIFVLVNVLLLLCLEFNLFFKYINIIERDSFMLFLSYLIIVSSLIISIKAISYLNKNSLYEYEFFLIMIIALLGFLVIIFSNNFLSIYIGIELQSLSLYLLASLKNNSTFAIEAGLKYFVLGAFASNLLLFGIVLLYGLFGIIFLNDIFSLLFFNKEIEQYLIIGLSISFMFIIISLIFKVGGAPFHMWLPDVYEGVASIITIFFALIPKISILSIFVKFVYEYNLSLYLDLNMLYIYIAILSLIVGSFGALGQIKIKRILSYSAIAHIGFFLFCFAIGNILSCVAFLIYLIVYKILIVSVFGSLIINQQYSTKAILKYIGNLCFLYKNNILILFILLVSLFAMAGIPPFSGFFSKLLIFLAAIKEGYTLFTIFFFFISIVSVVYYLRVIRAMLFIIKKREWCLFEVVNKNIAYIVSSAVLFNIFFIYVGNFCLYYIYSLSLIYLN